MGFRSGSYAKVWEVEAVSDTATKLRISISRKDKNTGTYQDEFSGYISCVGTAAAAKAARLREGDRIRLGDVDVTSRWDSEKKVRYTNFKCFSFEDADAPNSTAYETSAANHVESNDVDEDKLPF